MDKTNSIYLNRKFNISIDDLFKWIVEPNLISQWFGPKHLRVGLVDVNLTIGGSYKIELLKSNGEVFFIEGNYLEIEEPVKLVFSFKYKGLNNSPPDSVVKIKLEKIDERVSILTLIQKFETLPSDMKNRTKAWEYMLGKLAEFN